MATIDHPLAHPQRLVLHNEIHAKGGRAWGWPWRGEITTAWAIALVALAAWGFMRRVHARALRA